MLQNTTLDNEGNVIIREENYIYKCSHNEMMKIWRHLHFENGDQNAHPVRTYFKSLTPDQQKKITISPFTAKKMEHRDY